MEARNDDPVMADKVRVICAQIGARDHYAFARAFHHEGMLELLLTDYWHHSPCGWSAGFANTLKRRRHPDLAGVKIANQNIRTLVRELGFRMRGTRDWEKIVATNEAFQSAAIRVLEEIKDARPLRRETIVFSYSYGARRLFQVAKRRGWKTVLGQIDLGPKETRLVGQLEEAMPKFPSHRDRPPEGYYDDWHEELELADRIVVNSEWSREAMLSEGVPAEKLVVMPIPYELEQAPILRRVPESFSAERPLRLLFLGQVNLRKGAAELLEAMVALKDEPVELSVVGNTHFEVPEEVHKLESLRWHGQVPHHDTERFFQEADLFVLPTHSDGFGLAQVEALGHGLPVLTSPFCACMVEDGVNGRVMPEVTVQAIVTAIRGVLDESGQVAKWSAACKVPTACRMDNISVQLRELVREM